MQNFLTQLHKYGKLEVISCVFFSLKNILAKYHTLGDDFYEKTAT